MKKICLFFTLMSNFSFFLTEGAHLPRCDCHTKERIKQELEKHIKQESNFNKRILHFCNSGSRNPGGCLRKIPLFLSCKSDFFYDITNELLEKGADPNLIDGEAFEECPLIIAAENHALKTMKLLLRVGVSPNPNLYFLEKNQRLHMREPILFEICREGIRKNNSQVIKRIIRLLLRYGVDPDMRNEKGESIISKLCFSKDATAIIILLLKKGANITLQDKQGRDVIAAAEHFITKHPASFSKARPGFLSMPVEGLQFLKDWQAGKIKLKKKKIR